MIYPDSSVGTDLVKKSYYVDGNYKTITDQRNVVHTYGYNVRRQQKLDSVSIPEASDVDNSVQSIGRTFDDRGRVTRITSYAEPNQSGAISNEVGYTYENYAAGQYRRIEHQEHSGLVNTNVNGSWRVERTYDSSVTGDVFDNQLRMNERVIPGQTTVAYHYGDEPNNPNLIDDLQSRITSLSGNNTIASYRYNGDGRAVQKDLSQVGIRDSIHKEDNDGEYESWDRFGRLVDRTWLGGGVVLDQFDYRYDRLGNRLSRKTDQSVNSLNKQDYTLGYDGLNRLVDYREGALFNNTITLLSQQQQWTLDSLGNWTNVKEDRNGDGHNELDQNRSYNKANELTSVGGANAHVGFDAAGNRTRLTKPSFASHLDLKYDAWNRLVEVRDGASVTQTNEYDGLNRRIVRDETSDGGDKIHFYCYGHRVVEERKEISNTIDPDSLNYYVHCPRYIDSVLFVDHDADTDGTTERFYHLCDVTYNVTSLVNSTGAVVERYHYDPYGKASIMEPDFTLRANNTSLIQNELTFTGRRLDRKTGLMYFRARYYDPETGEFISRDPLGYVDGMSLYRGYFVPGGVDPSGSCIACPCVEDPEKCFLKYSSIKGFNSYRAKYSEDEIGRNAFEQKIATGYTVELIHKDGLPTFSCHIMQDVKIFEIYEDESSARPWTVEELERKNVENGNRAASREGFASWVDDEDRRKVVSWQLDDYTEIDNQISTKNNAIISDTPTLETKTISIFAPFYSQVKTYSFEAFNYVKEAPTITGKYQVRANFHWDNIGTRDVGFEFWRASSDGSINSHKTNKMDDWVATESPPWFEVDRNE